MADRSVLITDAPRSYEEQLAARKRRYATLMAGRLALFVLAAIAYPVSVWLAVALLALSVPLPWMAVLIANDAPARKGGTPTGSPRQCVHNWRRAGISRSTHLIGTPPSGSARIIVR